MTFQIIDDKLGCIGIYHNGELSLKKEIPMELTKTWNYTKHLESHEKCDIGKVLSGGKTLQEACPLELKLEFEVIIEKMKAFQKSLKISKIDSSQHCMIDLLPWGFLKKFCEIKNKITDYVFANYEKPKNYEFMLDLSRMLEDIKHQNINISKEALRPYLSKQNIRNLWKKIDLFRPQIAYNPYGTVTGRLGVQPGSFPILNIAREARRAILPTNDCFIEMDFNSAELRVLLALNNKEQPEIDIHEWNAKHIFKEDMDRDEIKKKTFSWLYNPKSLNKSLEMCYNKNYILEKYYDGSHVNTIFDRKIESDDHHALNYIIQSTTSDLFLKQAIKIWKLLKGKKHMWLLLSMILWCSISTYLIKEWSRDY